MGRIIHSLTSVSICSVSMCLVYCFAEAGKLSEERVYIDEAKMLS